MPFLQGNSLPLFILDNNELLLPVAAMTASHISAFLFSLFPSGRFDPSGVERYAEHPFSRIFVLAVIILVAPLVMGIIGMPLVVLAVFVLVKLSQDWRAGAFDRDPDKRPAGQTRPGQH